MRYGKKYLGVIPARGGSKRLPRKNVMELAGKHLIGWTIEAALKSNYLDEVIVSTDDEEIRRVSKKYGANVPFIRPKKLSTDEALSIDVVLHAIDCLKCKGGKFDYVVLLQPTSPMRSESHIDEAIELLNFKNADAIISVSEVEHSPLWSSVLPEDGSLMDFLNVNIRNTRSQDLPICHRINGALYICNIDRLFRERTFFIKDNIYAFKMNKLSSVDIDSKLDFYFSEFLLKS